MGIEPLFAQFGHDGIDQKRHVVIKDFNDRHAFETLAWCRLRATDLDLRSLPLPLAEEPPSSGCDRGDLGGFVAQQIFRSSPGKYLRDEIRRRVGHVVLENRGRILQEQASSIFIPEGINRRTEVLRLARTTSTGIYIHVTTSLIRAAPCSGNWSSGRSFSATMRLTEDDVATGFATCQKTVSFTGNPDIR